MASDNIQEPAMAESEVAPTMEYVSVVDPSQHTADTEALIKSLHMDPYDEDETELRFLHSKPTCFILIGKPGSGKTTLARRLAMEWKCEFINATDLILQNLELQTEVGLKFNEILTRGEAIPEEMVIKMIEDKINSPEVAHHGYVLDDFPCLSESFITIQDQLELVKNWKLRPDFIINLKIPDNDIEKRRLGQKIDPITGEIYTKDVYDPEKVQKTAMEREGEEEEEEEEEDDDEGGEEETEEETLPQELLERLIRRPEDIEQQVEDNILKYKNNMLRILEDYMADHDQQYLIEVDANQTITVLFKQLLARLSCFVLRPAAVPIRLWDPEDEEIPEDTDTDELMRLLAPKQMVAPRYRWRRSRWLRYCPVALFEGNMTQGKPEYAVSFLDKIYCLSSAEAMEKFLKNPRPYLLPPQPRPPCKLAVLGAPLSGKTTVCHLLANKYDAKVIDVEELIKPKLSEERKNVIQKIRDETTETAILTVKTKLKEQMEAAREAELEAMAAESEEQEEEEESEEKEEETGSPKDETPRETQEQTDSPKEEGKVETPEIAKPESAKIESVPEPEVDATHPEVIAIVDAAVREAEKQEVQLPADVYIEVMEAAIKDAERELQKKKPNGPMSGGWILDNFPNTRDQWAVCIEKNITPDDVIILKDNSDNGSCLMERYYQLNKEEVDQKMNIRLAQESEEKAKKEAEKKRQEEEAKKAAEEAKRQAAEEEKQRRLEEGEEVTEGDGETTDHQSVDGDEERESQTEDTPKDELEMGDKPEIPPAGEGDEDSLPAESEKSKIPDGPEMDIFREKKKEFEKEFPSVHSTISGNTSIEPQTVDIEDQTIEKVVQNAVDKIEKPIRYQAWERSGIDIDEEEEDIENDIPEEEEEEPEEEEDPNRSRKKHLGETNHFCPVTLKENNVLAPGNPEIAAIFRERIYYFTTLDSKDKFLENPVEFLPTTKTPQTPPTRLLILGQKGAGKTLHGRNLARKLGLFHISFNERLQELIIAKTKRKIGPEYEEEPFPVLEEQEEENEDGAIIGPDGEPVNTDKDLETKESGVVEPEEEEIEIEFTEDEEAIKANLESDEPLPSEVMDNILTQWWHKEPFKSTGFILEGFPRTADEVRYLAEMGLFTDAALILSVTDADVIGRLLPPKLDIWKIKRDKRVAIKEKRKEKAKKKRVS
ncbi:adenylate kinase 9 [Patella vulgata]|uniref:adenylate kinase 9 n=1 Tax=Patella vulgata TaxID=6465 RepID=UPI0024A92A6C|nr:adenylate kinase 9 [Patella vulgata]